MRTRLIGLIVVVASVAVLRGQQGLPPDIHPESLSRLPPVQRDALDEAGKAVFDRVAGARGLPRTGPGAVTMHSPGIAGPIQDLNQYLRKTVAGSRYFELSALIAAREFDQQYQWSGHEPAGLKAGLEQSVIDVVKFNRDVAGLSEKDATVIRLGRAMFRDHKVSSELWAKDRRVLRTSGRCRDRGDDGRLCDGRLHPDRRRSTAAGGSEADAALTGWWLVAGG